MATSSFNKKHPEIGKGEVFLTNSEARHYNDIGWSTKRVGRTAYDVNGKIVKGLYPVFVQRSELEKNGINPDDI